MAVNNKEGNGIFLPWFPLDDSTPPEIYIVWSYNLEEFCAAVSCNIEEFYEAVAAKEDFARWVMTLRKEYVHLDPNLEICYPIPELICDPEGNLYIDPNFPFLFAIWNFAELTLNQLTQLLENQERIEENKIKTWWTVFQEYCLEFLPAVREIAEKRVNWKVGRKIEDKNGRKIYEKSSYRGDEYELNVYYTPEIPRFGINKKRPNPYGFNPKDRRNILFIQTEVRFDLVRGTCLTADFNVWRWGNKKKEELVDNIFGKGRHHLKMVGGQNEEACKNLILSFMESLGLNDIHDQYSLKA